MIELRECKIQSKPLSPKNVYIRKIKESSKKKTKSLKHVSGEKIKFDTIKKARISFFLKNKNKIRRQCVGYALLITENGIANYIEKVEKITFRKKERSKSILYPNAIIYAAFYRNYPIYVGQTTLTLEERVERHLQDSKRKKTQFYDFMISHDYDIRFGRIEILNNVIQNEINDAEKYWIKFFDTFEHGCNSTPGGR